MRRALLLGVVLAVTAPLGLARAGTYVVHTCGAGGVNNAWHATPPPLGVMEANEACHADPQMDGIWVRDVLASPSDLTDGQGAWLQLDAPAGTTIGAITYSRWLWKDAIDDLHPELRTADGTVLETCSIPYGQLRCDLGGEGTGPVTFSGLSTTRLQAGVRCQVTPPFVGCAGGGTEHGYGAVITDAAIRIDDPTPPAAPALASSGLWSGAAWYRGSSSVTVSGGDASGISAVRVYAGGQLLTQSAPACDFTRPKPCDDVAGLEVPIDTSQLSDGQHTIAVALVDAAGNESPSVSRSVLVANDPPGVPQLTITPAQADSPGFTASWTPAPGHVLPIALAHIAVCHDLACSQMTTTASSVQLSAPAPGTTTVSVYLEDTAGNVDPQRAASVVFLLDAPATSPTPPGPEPQPGSAPAPPPSSSPAGRARPSIGLGAVARYGYVHITARIRATGWLSFVIRVSGQDRHHRWSRVLRRHARIRHKRATVRVALPAGAARVDVRAAFGGSAQLLATSAKRVVRVR